MLFLVHEDGSNLKTDYDKYGLRCGATITHIFLVSVQNETFLWKTV